MYEAQSVVTKSIAFQYSGAKYPTMFCRIHLGPHRKSKRRNYGKIQAKPRNMEIL